MDFASEVMTPDSSWYGGDTAVAAAPAQLPGEMPGPSIASGEIADWQTGGGGNTPRGGLGGFADKVVGGLKTVGGAIGDQFSNDPLGSFAKSLGIGSSILGGVNSLNAQKQSAQQLALTKKSQKEAEAAAAPAVSFGTTTLNNAAAGNLPPGLQAGIDQWVQQQKAQVASRFAAMGEGNSDQIDQANRLIDQQAMAMKGQLLQGQEETGIAGLNTGVAAATGVMGSSQQQQQQLDALIAQANKSMASLTGAAA